MKGGKKRPEMAIQMGPMPRVKKEYHLNLWITYIDKFFPEY